MLRHAVVLLCATIAAAPALFAEVAETERQSHELRFERPTQARLRVDLVSGSVTVTGSATDSAVATVTVRRTADDPERLARARHDVRLAVERVGDEARFVVETPWDRDGRRRDFPGWRRLGYEVAYDLVIEVPRATAIDLETVWGDLVVAGVEGPFDVGSVFGEVRLAGLVSAGVASTVNGPLWAAFASAPGAASELSTVNGAIEVRLPRSAQADLTFKTLNGEVTTDLPVRTIPRPAGVAERDQGRFVYRSAAGAWVRLGDGGPVLAFETVNGDITLLAAEEETR